MKRTYIFRRYIQKPKLFIDLWIPSVWTRDEVEVLITNVNDIFMNQQFIDSNNINVYTITSHKQVNRSKLYIRRPSWEYIVPELFQEDTLHFYVLNGSNQYRNCYISSTKEWFKQLSNQANNSRLEVPYLNLLENSINLNSILTRFDTINLIWIWFSINWNPNLKSIKLKWNQSVTESREAQQAIADWGIIKYIEFSHNDYNITLYDDFSFSFYSDLDVESDINLINEVLSNYNLLTT